MTKKKTKGEQTLAEAESILDFWNRGPQSHAAIALAMRIQEAEERGERRGERFGVLVVVIAVVSVRLLAILADAVWGP